MKKTRQNLTPDEQKKKDSDMVEAFAQFAPLEENHNYNWLLDDFGEDDLRAVWTEIGEQKEAAKKKGQSK